METPKVELLDSLIEVDRFVSKQRHKLSWPYLIPGCVDPQVADEPMKVGSVYAQQSRGFGNAAARLADRVLNSVSLGVPNTVVKPLTRVRRRRMGIEDALR